MLQNDNKAIVRKLARHGIRTNFRKYLVMFLAVVLSAFMLFSVLTVGATYFAMWKRQNIRLNGARFDAIMYGCTDAQMQKLKQNADITDIGVLALAGYLDETEKNTMADTSMAWVNDTYWNKMQAPAKTSVKGTYPTKENEVMVTPEALKECGLSGYGIGDSFWIKWTDDAGNAHKTDVTICGIWDGYGTKNMFYVSKGFYDRTGRSIDKVSSGRILLNFRQKILSQKKQQQFIDGMKLGKQQRIFFTTTLGYSLPIYMGLLVLIFVTCLCAYLLIYNILYLSVTENIRYYGLLQTIGMTAAQIRGMLARQMAVIGIFGIAVGIAAGAGTSFLVIPKLVHAFGIQEAVQVQFHFAGVLIAAAVTAVTIVVGSRKPVKIAASVSPVDASRYLAGSVSVHKYKKSRIHKRQNVHRIWEMSVRKVRKDKKKSAVIILSLAMGLSVFLCVITLLESQGPRTIVSSVWADDMEITNRSLKKEDKKWRDVLSDAFVQKIRQVDGVKEVRTICVAKAMVPWEPDVADRWMREFYETWMEIPYEKEVQEYKAHPEKFATVLVGLDEKNFQTLNESLDKPVDADAFLKGESCILYLNGLEFENKDLVGKTLTAAEYKNAAHTFSFSIAGLTDDSSYTGPMQGYPPTIIISAQALQNLGVPVKNYKACVYYDKAYDKGTQARVLNLLKSTKNSNCLGTESKLENLKELKAAQGNMREVGISISLILAWIGVMNYINTVVGNIESRRKELAILESIGMTRRQCSRMLVYEGGLYAFFALLVMAGAGLPVTYALYESMNYMAIPFLLPWRALLVMVLVLFLVCIGVPLLFVHGMYYRNSSVRIHGNEE